MALRTVIVTLDTFILYYSDTGLWVWSIYKSFPYLLLYLEKDMMNLSMFLVPPLELIMIIRLLKVFSAVCVSEREREKDAGDMEGAGYIMKDSELLTCKKETAPTIKPWT